MHTVVKVNCGTRPWLAIALVESTGAALCVARIAFGPITQSPSRSAWLGGTILVLMAYFCMALWATASILANSRGRERRPNLLLGCVSVPFLAVFSLEMFLLQFRPDVGGWIWDYLSTIQPFPILAMAIVLLLVFLLKTLAVSLSLPRDGSRARLFARSADIAIPIALLLIGVLQASVYLTPIGNAFLRFWAIADAVGAGVGYPVTLTEPGPVAAGSPPYVYDLPLFPMLLLGAFKILGHNSAAGHVPAAIFNALFPLSIYLLIREATRSRTAALLFGTLTSLFPYLRFWVLNLPDPDPFLLTSLCFAAYSYLRALSAPERPARWLIAGIASGVLSLARPEGVLYAGFLGLGLLASRPKVRQLTLYLLGIGLFLIPMIVVWQVSFGFLWPQNYNRTLRLDYPLENYHILDTVGALLFYHRGLGLDAEWALGLLIAFVLAVLLGTLLMAARAPRLLAMAVPGIGNTVAIFFANPYIPNTFHFADFFRHASFGIPFLVVVSAYGLCHIYRYLAGRARLRAVAYLGLLLLVMAVVREGDILANPTATHHTGATQVLTAYPHLSMQDILEHPFQLPPVGFYRKDSVVVAHCDTMAWPDDALDFYRPLDMSFDSRGRPFGYASMLAFLLGLCFALLAEGSGAGVPASDRDATTGAKKRTES